MLGRFLLVFLLWASLALSGCCLSHERPRDAGMRDAPRPDVAVRDAPDAGPIVCNRIVIEETVALEGQARGAVTPRLVALSGGEVGVVYVKTDGDPTRVLFERRAADLSAVGAPREISRNSFTWAEPALFGGEVFIAYGLGDGFSELHRDAGSVRVPLEHPSLLLPLEEGFFWGSFDSRTTNALVLSTVAPDGSTLRDPVRIELGRYGSGHHAVVRPDSSSVVVGYPSEGPPGVRRGHVARYDDGRLISERELRDEDVTSVWVLDDEGGLVVVSNGDALVLERASYFSLEAADTVFLPAIEERFVAGILEGRVVIGRFASGRFVVDVYDPLFRLQETLEVALPAAGLSGATSVASLPGALVIAAGLSDGSTSFPWLARLACAE